MKRIDIKIGGQGNIEEYAANYELTGDGGKGNFPDPDRRPDLLALFVAVNGRTGDSFVDIIIEGQGYLMTSVVSDGNFTFKRWELALKQAI